MKKAEIVTFEAFNSFRDSLGTIVATSGGFDPIHPGHLSCFFESKKLGDTLVVIVNGDSFLERKKGVAFMDLQTRMDIVSFAQGVDYVIPFEIKNDQTVVEALRMLHPHIFTKGGDRIDEKTIPEWQICNELGVKIVTGVGYDKKWSSSDFLKKWLEVHNK